MVHTLQELSLHIYGVISSVRKGGVALTWQVSKTYFIYN